MPRRPYFIAMPIDIFPATLYSTVLAPATRNSARCKVRNLPLSLEGLALMLPRQRRPCMAFGTSQRGSSQLGMANGYERHDESTVSHFSILGFVIIFDSRDLCLLSQHTPLRGPCQAALKMPILLGRLGNRLRISITIVLHVILI